MAASAVGNNGIFEAWREESANPYCEEQKIITKKRTSAKERICRCAFTLPVLKKGIAFLDEKLVDRVQCSLTGHKDLAAVSAALEGAAAPGSLIGNQLILAQQICPVGDDVAMAGTAYRVF